MIRCKLFYPSFHTMSVQYRREALRSRHQASLRGCRVVRHRHFLYWYVRSIPRLCASELPQHSPSVPRDLGTYQWTYPTTSRNAAPHLLFVTCGMFLNIFIPLQKTWLTLRAFEVWDFRNTLHINNRYAWVVCCRTTSPTFWIPFTLFFCSTGEISPKSVCSSNPGKMIMLSRRRLTL